MIISSRRKAYRAAALPGLNHAYRTRPTNRRCRAGRSVDAAPGHGEQSDTLTLAAIIISFSSVYVTDVKGWIRLPDRLADLLGLGAAVLAIFQWQSDVSDAGLLALLSFVIYGQFVLQLKAKGISTYWLLIALSLMETAVSTVRQ